MGRLPRLLAGLLAGLALGCGDPDVATRPHLLLVTADSLRADHLSGFGYPRATSPTLDAFAEGAWSFRQALTVMPKTAPAFATVFTGLHPREHGVGSNFVRIPDAAPMLAETLRDAGYRTAAFVSNPALRRANGFARGFDVYQEIDGADRVMQTLQAYHAWSRAAWDRPTFVWIHWIDPHGPYAPRGAYAALFQDDAARDPERVRKGYELGDTETPNKVLGAVPRYQQRPDGEDRIAAYVRRYDAEIRYVDDAFGLVLEDLEQRGLHDRTAVVFTSDHGESLGEHDYYFEHGWFAYEPTLHVPLFLRTPGQQQGRRVERVVSLLDLRATLLSVAGVSDPSPGSGRDLLTLGPEDAAVVVENGDLYPRKIQGLRDGAWKYLRDADGGEELYDLRDDPDELRNRIDAETERADAMRDALARRLATLRASALTPGGSTRDDDATEDRLRALGYVR